MSQNDDRQNNYICGKCRYQIDYLASDEPPVPCPECGYEGKEIRITDVPSKVKLDLTQY